jgi:hypothetical protein
MNELSNYMLFCITFSCVTGGIAVAIYHICIAIHERRKARQYGRRVRALGKGNIGGFIK